MNLVRQLRDQANVTQTELARLAGTSQPTIAAYEMGAKSPSLRTVRRLAASLNLELCAAFVPRMTREDHRSLAFHREIAARLRKNPEQIVEHARRNLAKLTTLHPGARTLFERWSSWLGLTTEDLISQMLRLTLEAREMRHVSPLSGILTAQERARVLAKFRRDLSR